MKRILSVLTLALAAVGANAQTVDTTLYRLDFSPGTSIKRFSGQHNTADYSRVASATNRLGQAMIASTVLDGFFAGEVDFYRVDASGNVYYTGRTECPVFAPEYSISATGNILLPASVTIFQTYSSSATFTDFITGSGLVTTTVENSVRIVGFETVTVPAGTFTALKIVDTEVWSSDAAPGITTSWLVSGLGIVKIVFDYGDGEELKHYVVLNAQPQAQTVAAGASATLSVTATGGGSSLTYQWRKDGVNVSGANASSYSITGAQASHAGSYTVVVSNTAGSVTSSAATLTVNALLNLPTITTPPQSQVAIVTSNVTFTVAATGSGLTYQWRKDGVAIGNATSATLTLNSVTRAASGVYSVVVTSGGTSTTSGNATLRVIVPQQLSSQRGGSGQFQLLFTDPDNAVGSDRTRFEVHHTANFLGASTVWVTNSGSFTLSSSGKILFDDTGSVGTARRFYRVIEK